MDVIKTRWEKAEWKHPKNNACCLEQILKATLHKIVAVRPPTYHFTNYSIKTNKSYGAWLEKQGRTHSDVPLWTCQCWPTSGVLLTSIPYRHRIYANDQPGPKDDRDGCRERKRKRERERILWYQQDLMMVNIYIYIYIYTYIYILSYSHPDFKEEKARWELYKAVACNFQQRLETVLQKTATLLQTIKDEQGMLSISIDKLISDVLLWTGIHKHTRIIQLSKTHIPRFSADTYCCQEDPSRATFDW